MIKNQDIAISGEPAIKKSKLLSLVEEHIFSPLREAFLKSESDNKKKYADIILRNSLGQVLLVHRAYTDDFMNGKWGFPGGKIEAGEDAAVAAKRELKEETGLDAEVTFLEKHEKEDCIIWYYEALVLANDKDAVISNMIILDTEEHIGYEWVDLSNVKDYELIADLANYVDGLFGKLFKVCLIAPKAQLTPEELPTDPMELLNFHWDKIVKGFDAGLLDEEKYLTARVAYLKKCEELGGV